MFSFFFLFSLDKLEDFFSYVIGGVSIVEVEEDGMHNMNKLRGDKSYYKQIKHMLKEWNV